MTTAQEIIRLADQEADIKLQIRNLLSDAAALAQNSQKLKQKDREVLAFVAKKERDPWRYWAYSISRDGVSLRVITTDDRGPDTQVSTIIWWKDFPDLMDLDLLGMSL